MSAAILNVLILIGLLLLLIHAFWDSKNTKTIEKEDEYKKLDETTFMEDTSPENMIANFENEYEAIKEKSNLGQLGAP